MKKSVISFLMCVSLGTLFAQKPVLYVNFVSHNEPGDNLQQSSKFNAMQSKVLQLADIFDAKNACWNLETCDGFASGALNIQGVSNNIFRTITSGKYSENIEIDPRPKTSLQKLNIADTYRILDTLGCNPTNTLGGFLYYNQNGSPDWFTYENEIKGITYPWKKWRANLMWGAGSNPPHSHDLNDFGIWKPDTTNNFYSHNEKRTLWYMGNGCQPLQALDSTENEQTIITYVKGFVDSIQTGKVPSDKFYVYSIIINQSHFGPTLFKKVSNVIDSINKIGNDKIQWKRLTEKFAEFESWKTKNKVQYSQWNCGDEMANVDENLFLTNYSIYPNPTNKEVLIKFDDVAVHNVNLLDPTGKIISEYNAIDQVVLDLEKLSKGIYFIQIDNAGINKLIKE